MNFHNLCDSRFIDYSFTTTKMAWIEPNISRRIKSRITLNMENILHILNLENIRMITYANRMFSCLSNQSLYVLLRILRTCTDAMEVIHDRRDCILQMHIALDTRKLANKS